MNLKKKLNKIKQKIHENRYEIASATIAAVTATAIMHSISNKKVKEASAALKFIKYVRNHDTLFISEITKQEVLSGSQDVWFDVDGHRFDVTLNA